MPRASGTNSELRCDGCNRLLARNDAIKCPRCGSFNPIRRSFATEVKSDEWITTFLWRPDGTRGASICILKRFEVFTRRLLFDVYNHIDPSKACSPDSGCRVNAKPYLNLDRALVVARRMEQEALKSGEWVRLEDLEL